MSNLQNYKLCLASGVLVAMLAGSGRLSYGVTGCKPQSPCPCAADGVCRPNRETWGHYRTRWRTWPGEVSRDEPTPADTPSAEERTLPPFETPTPEQEDLRGPAKDKKVDEQEEASAGEADVPAPLLPGPETLPAIDPQGNQLELPPLEDAPPELPESLRQAALLLNTPHFTQAPTDSVKMPTTVQPASPTVQPASWQQPAPGLVNPASTAVTGSEPNSLQQAIYYEASDQGEEDVE